MLYLWGVLLSQLDKSAAARDAIHLVFNEPCSHLRALGRRNGSSPLAPCRDLSFSQQCWSLPQTRFLARLPRQVFLERIILDERGEGRAERSAGRRVRRARRPSCSSGREWSCGSGGAPSCPHFHPCPCPCSCPTAPQAPCCCSCAAWLEKESSCLVPAHRAALKTGLGFCRQMESSQAEDNPSSRTTAQGPHIKKHSGLKGNSK